MEGENDSMLQIYTNYDIRNNTNFLVDSDCLIARYGILDNEYSRKVIREIDNGLYLDKEFFMDRNGKKLSLEFLSTTAKILLALPVADCIINGTSLGNNCGELLLQNTKGKIFIPGDKLYRLEYGFSDEKLDYLLIDGMRMSDFDRYIDYARDLR